MPLFLRTVVRGGSGAILRDASGSFIAASCSDIRFVEDAATAEARGLRDGLILANDMGCNKLVIEADCMEVIQVMQSGGNSLEPAAAIYEECAFICRNFVSVSFQHCPREANMAVRASGFFVRHFVRRCSPFCS